jgi:uncharacterized membrane protein
MEKQNNKTIQYFDYFLPLLKFLALIIFAFIISFIITNWRVLMLPSSERVLKGINLYGNNITFENFSLENNGLRMTEGNTSIRINTNNNYIEKFKYTYEIKNNVDVEVLLTEIDSYGNPFENPFSDRLLTDIDLSAISIRNNVSSIELKFNGEELLIKELLIDNRISFNPYIFLTILIIGFVAFIVLFYREKLLAKVENVFLLIAVTSGILFTLLLPNRLGLSWDDQIHFLNVYSLSHGRTVEWTESTLQLINNVVSNNFTFFDTTEERSKSNQYLNNHHDYSDIINSQENNVSWGYNKLVYLPMVLGFKIPETLGLPLTVSLLISKFANLFVYITIIYLAIKNIPICKRLLACIALLPGSMFLATQFSYDPPITAFVFLAIAMMTKMVLSKKTVSIADIIIFAISIIIASSPKGVYVLLILFPLFLPTKKFKDKKQKRRISFILIFILALVVSSFIIPILFEDASLTDLRGGDTSASRQLLLIKDKPISFLKIFFNNVSEDFLNKFVGVGTITHFAYVGIIPSSNLYILSLFLLSFFTFTDTYNQDKQSHISKNLKFVILAILVGIISLIWLTLYLSFTPVESTIINGVQGRYFIPLLPLLLLLFNSYKIKNEIPETSYNLILLFSSITILLGSIFTMILGNYCF